jgi:hypothetical protein
MKNGFTNCFALSSPYPHAASGSLGVFVWIIHKPRTSVYQ